MSPIHNFPSCFPKIYLNIMFPFMPRSSKCSLPFGFSDKFCVHFLYLPLMVCAPPIPWLDHHNIWWNIQSMKLHSITCCKSMGQVYKKLSDTYSWYKDRLNHEYVRKLGFYNSWPSVASCYFYDIPSIHKGNWRIFVKVGTVYELWFRLHGIFN